MFLSPSLRTHLGFSIAASSLGAHPHDVDAMRFAAGMAAPEALDHAIRIASAWSSLVVVRAPILLTETTRRAEPLCPVINAGDMIEHPTQALIDLFAMQTMRRPVETLRVGISGDLEQRCVRSLLQGFNVLTPKELRLMSPTARRNHEVELLPALRSVTIEAEAGDWGGLDVIYLAGLPKGSGAKTLSDDARMPFAMNADSAARLPDDAVVLSPMPVIDEIAADQWSDPRIRVFQQSDMALAVRRAVLRHFWGLRV